jgi:Uma2 family endonuclease
MAVKTLMSVEEYLRTSFDGSDCEYLDGEIVERNMGEFPHARLQAFLCHLLLLRGSGLQVVTEIRTQISPTRFRIPDIAVWRPGYIGTRIPTVPPFLAVEILSPEDRMVRMQPKIQEYLSIGVEWVWVIDPEEKRALVYSQSNPAGELAEVLRTGNPKIEIPLEEIFQQS